MIEQLSRCQVTGQTYQLVQQKMFRYVNLQESLTQVRPKRETVAQVSQVKTQVRPVQASINRLGWLSKDRESKYAPILQSN